MKFRETSDLQRTVRDHQTKIYEKSMLFRKKSLAFKEQCLIFKATRLSTVDQLSTLQIFDFQGAMHYSRTKNKFMEVQ